MLYRPKTIFLYGIIVSVFAVVIGISLLFFWPKPNPRILLLHSNGFGEQETVARLAIAARRVNVDLSVLNVMAVPGQADQLVNQKIDSFKPDFILSIEDNIHYYPGIPNYLTLTRGGYNRYIQDTSNGIVDFTSQHLGKFDALLPSLPDFSLIKSAFEQKHRKFFGFSWYPTVYSTKYSPATPKQLFYSGGVLWDSTRRSDKYMEVFKKLDETGYFRVCGINEFWQHTPNSHVGFLAFDGKSIIENIHDYGVSLILHYKEHLDGGAPTARVFEAAAANAVIISDRHPFLVQNFGDNILYIDVDQDAESIFRQIDQHMQWILSHPQEAQRMANACHTIVEKQFTLEKQLRALLKMHKKFAKLYEKY